MWISPKYTNVPSLLNLPPIPLVYFGFEKPVTLREGKRENTFLRSGVCAIFVLL